MRQTKLPCNSRGMLQSQGLCFVQHPRCVEDILCVSSGLI